MAVARMSAVIAGQINDDNDDDEIENEFPCPKVSGDILQKVVDYCTHYQEEEPMEKIETPLQGETIDAIVKPEWYVRYCEVDKEIMFQLVAAANYLNIKPLLDLTCLAVSVSVKGKTVKELREIFQFPAPPENNSNSPMNTSKRTSNQNTKSNNNDCGSSIGNNHNNSDNNSSKKRSHAEANLQPDHDDNDRQTKPTPLDFDHHHDEQQQQQQQQSSCSFSSSSSSSWEKILKQFPRCCPASNIEETSVFCNKFQATTSRTNTSNNSKTTRHNYLRHLISELSNLEESLPASPPAIYVRFDEDAPQYMRILMTGPHGTPYSLGLFCFDLYVPHNYPNSPPVMKLLTTGQGTVRFSPNLYANGTVCLSLLNTWEGPKWDKGQSTILQVLMSIQALILGAEHPYYLEPGHGGWEGQKSVSGNGGGSGIGEEAKKVPAHVRVFEDKIREGTLRYAMLDHIAMVNGSNSGSSNSPPAAKYKYLECFQDILQAHFYHHRQDIVEIAQTWAKAWNTHSHPKYKLDKYVQQLQEAVSKLDRPAFLDQEPADATSTAATATTAVVPRQENLLLDNHKNNDNNSHNDNNSNNAISRLKSLMEQAALQKDYIAAGRFQLEISYMEKHGTVASKIASKRQEMEQRASIKDYIGAGALQMQLQYLEQNQVLLTGLERRMFEAASQLDFCRAGKIQQQHRVLLMEDDEAVLDGGRGMDRLGGRFVGGSGGGGGVSSTAKGAIAAAKGAISKPPVTTAYDYENYEDEDDYYDEEDYEDEMHHVLFGGEGMYHGEY
jgi:Ubiquitin-protein ligase